MLIEYIYISK